MQKEYWNQQFQEKKINFWVNLLKNDNSGYGLSWVQISMIVTPKLHTSDFVLYWFFVILSGLIHYRFFIFSWIKNESKLLFWNKVKNLLWLDQHYLLFCLHLHLLNWFYSFQNQIFLDSNFLSTIHFLLLNLYEWYCCLILFTFGLFVGWGL